MNAYTTIPQKASTEKRIINIVIAMGDCTRWGLYKVATSNVINGYPFLQCGTKFWQQDDGS